jgi:hypothetical protein
MKKTLTVMAIVLMAAVVAFPCAAHAYLTLYLDDNVGHSVTIVDGGVGDTNPNTGAITYGGPVGGWTFNVTTAITTPLVGGPFHVIMDLNSVDMSGGPGTLTLMFNNTGFTLPSLNNLASMHIGGTIGLTTPGTVTYSSYFDSTNSSFLPPTVNGSIMGPLVYSGIGAFGGTLTSNIATGTDPFALTQVVTIQHNASGLTSFNASLDIVPLPASVLLLGSGLLGLVGLGWRRRKES